jgi:hypothetical protein
MKNQDKEKLVQLDGTSPRENNRRIGVFIMQNIKSPKVHVLKPEYPYNHTVFEKYFRAICNVIARYWLLGALISIGLFVFMIIVALLPIFKACSPFEMKFKPLDHAEKVTFSHMRLQILPNESKPENHTLAKSVSTLPRLISHIEKNHSNEYSFIHLAKANKSNLVNSAEIKKIPLGNLHKKNHESKWSFLSKITSGFGSTSRKLNGVHDDAIMGKRIENSDIRLKRGQIKKKMSPIFLRKNSQPQFASSHFQDVIRNTRFSHNNAGGFKRSQSKFDEKNVQLVHRNEIKRDYYFLPNQFESNSFNQRWNRVPLEGFENLFF